MPPSSSMDGGDFYTISEKLLIFHKIFVIIVENNVNVLPCLTR